MSNLKNDILQTRDCKSGYTKMMTIIKIGFTFAPQFVVWFWKDEDVTLRLPVKRTSS